MTTPASMTLPAQLSSLAPSLAFVSSCSAQRGFDDRRAREIELCLEEVLVNIANYAYPEGPGNVEITCDTRDDGAFVIEVADWGISFDVLSVDDPNTALGVDERKIGGLGIFFVKQLMDDVRYRREGNKNILTLCINQPSSRPSPP